MPSDTTAVAREPLLLHSDLRSGARVRPAEWLVPAAISAALFVACAIISPKKPIWFDEVISWTIASDPSISHMVRALAHGADGIPPTYYLVAQFWRSVFGNSPLSLRMLSPVGLGVGVFSAYAALRRVFTASATGLSVVLVFCVPWIILFQSSELRPYGMFMGLSGLALWLYTQSLGSKQVLVGLVACHAVLVLCHPFGIIYSAAMWLALLAWGARTKRLPSAALMATAAGCLAILLWIVPFVRLAEMAKPKLWIAVPSLQDLLASYAFGMRAALAITAIVLLAGRMLAAKREGGVSRAERKRLLTCAAFLIPGTLLPLLSGGIASCAPVLVLAALGILALSTADQPGTTSSLPLLYVAVALLSVPPVAFAISHLSAPVFLGRYLLPSRYGVAVLIAGAVQNVRWAHVLTSARLRGFVWATIVPIAVALPSVRSVLLSPTEVPLFGTSRRAVEALAPPIRPVVVEDPLAFLPLTADNRQPAHEYYFLLDRSAALTTPTAHPMVNFNILQVWADYGYLSGHILPPDEFLRTNRSFLVLHDRTSAWFELRIAHNSEYSTRSLGRAGESVLVEVRQDPGRGR